MPKTIKEFQLNQSTGEVSVEYSDDITSKFNAADMVTAQTDPVTGVVSFGPTTTKAATAARAAMARNPLIEEHTTQCTVTGGLWSADLANALQMSTNQGRFT